MAKNLLTLDTLAQERDYITIDGKPYEILAPEDFGLIEQARLQKIGRRMLKLQGGEDDEIPDQDVEAAAKGLRDFVKTVLPELPETVLEKLSDGKCMQIVEAFTLAIPSQPQQKRRKAKGESPSTESSESAS